MLIERKVKRERKNERKQWKAGRSADCWGYKDLEDSAQNKDTL